MTHKKMIKRSMAYVLCMLFGVTAVFQGVSVETSAATTEDGYCVINVTASDIENSGTSSAIQSALNEAKENATEETPYKIVVEEGAYTTTTALKIYSNTYLYLEDVTLTQESGRETNIIKVGDASDEQSGYYYENITIEGGTLDENGNDSTTVKVGHAANFTMLNVTVRNVNNAHLMEVAGVDGLTIKGCTFEEQELSTSSSTMYYEAIQLDIPISDHIVGYLSEALASKDIVIDNCTFNNVPRGVGSHTTFINAPYDGVTITNCTFTDIKSCAIQGMNWINCTITGNTITDSPRGIAIYSVREDGTYLASTAVAEGGISTSISDSYTKPSTSQNIVIKNNTITCSGTDPYASYEKVGILLEGITFSSSYSGGASDTIPAGDYYISGATISGNTITTTGHGIRLTNAKNSTLSSNIISYTGSSSGTAYYGIQIRTDSTSNKITDNIISKTNSNGIYVYSGASASSITGNTIKSAGKYGIDVEDATATTISSNAISSPSVNGIFVYNGAKVTTISSNTITSAGKYGIDVENATVTTIKSNTITSPKVNGIYIYNGSKATTISSNKITSAGKYGIDVESSTATTIKSNTIKSSTTNGIFIYNGSKVSTISSNTITSAGKYGIGIENATATTIKSNTIKSSANNGINVYNKAKVTTIKSNTISSSKGYGILLYSVSAKTTISSNTVSSCSKNLIVINPQSTSNTITVKSNTLTGKSSIYGIYVSSGKVSISGNTIKSCNYPILIGSSAKGSLYKNTYKSNSNNMAKVNSKAYKNLSKVTSVKTTKKSKTSITVSWKKNSNADGYIIYRATSKSGTYKKVKTITKNSTVKYTNTGLTKGKKYYYKVRAYKKSTNGKVTIYSPYSAIVSKQL